MKKIFKYVKDWIIKWYKYSFDVIRDNSDVAVNVTNKLKEIVESPIADVVVTIIPSDVDDKILKKLREVLPIVATKMAVMHGILKMNDSDSDVINSIINHLKSINPDLRTDFWVRFTGELNVALADGEISLSEGIGLSQILYEEQKIRMAA